VGFADDCLPAPAEERVWYEQNSYDCTISAEKLAGCEQQYGNEHEPDAQP
jgi:hypothetical protein